jgi:hypothetical protein
VPEARRRLARELRGERSELRALRIDLEREAAIPVDDHVAGLVDLADNAAVAGAEPGVLTQVADELDPCSDRYAGSDPSRKELCTVGVHDVHIGFDGQELDPFVGW